MPIIDISRTLKPGTAVWPGDTPYSLKYQMRIEAGDSVNLTTLQLSAHTGSHIDAPRHFTQEGLTIDSLDLTVFWGKVQVFSVAKKGGALIPDDFSGCDLSIAPRILIRSNASLIDQSVFPLTFVYPSPELAEWLGAGEIILFGTDAPSVDALDSRELAGHRALSRYGISILEWLDLSQAADGVYELAALPLKITGGDGSPVRAVLRALL